MVSISIKELLEAGVHFGHQTNRWNPKMKSYIFGQRNGIYIIDLQRTLKKFRAAASFVVEQASQGKTILFVGTKRQAQETIAEEATRCGMTYVNARWLGGTLTNFNTLRKSIQRLAELEELTSDEKSKNQTKKELARLEKERTRLEKGLSGIKGMTCLPDALFVVDPKRERIAVNEARKLGLSIVAIVDTNCDPEPIDHVIPGNDDAIRSIKLFASRIADCVIEGAALHQATVKHEETDASVRAEKAAAGRGKGEQGRRAAAGRSRGGRGASRETPRRAEGEAAAEPEADAPKARTAAE